VCVALLVVITVLRIAVSNPIEAVGFLYVIPISMLASELGVRGGLLAGVGATALTIFWALIKDVPLGLIGYGARTGTFLGIGLIVGLQSQRRLKLQADRERLIAALHATAMRDQLTGLPNRRAWDDRFEPELERARRSGQPLSVAVLDLDRLKQINDTHGHEQGDRLIRRCAHAWAGALGRSDFLARLGGDESSCCCPIALTSAPRRSREGCSALCPSTRPARSASRRGIATRPATSSCTAPTTPCTASRRLAEATVSVAQGGTSRVAVGEQAAAPLGRLVVRCGIGRVVGLAEVPATLGTLFCARGCRHPAAWTRLFLGLVLMPETLKEAYVATSARVVDRVHPKLGAGRLAHHGR
jgi:GGDEF domain-containing protein